MVATRPWPAETRRRSCDRRRGSAPGHATPCHSPPGAVHLPRQGKQHGAQAPEKPRHAEVMVVVMDGYYPRTPLANRAAVHQRREQLRRGLTLDCEELLDSREFHHPPHDGARGGDEREG
jgi:hypothetical protein